MKLFRSCFMCVFLLVSFWSFLATAQPQLGEVHQELAGGILAQARLDALPEGEVLRADDIVVTVVMLKEQMDALPETVREQAESFQFYLLEGIATESILMREVLGDADASPDEATLRTAFSAYMMDAVGEISISDADIEAFYEENRAMLPDNMPLEQMRSGIEGHLKQQKQEEAWNEHLQGMGSQLSIILDETWTTEQVRRMQENPVDKARASGKPTLANFGAQGCPACRALKPVMDSLQEKFPDEVVIIEVNLNEQQFLANRFNVSSIPLLVFFDKDGKEVYRHTGAMSEEDILKQLAELGVI